MGKISNYLSETLKNVTTGLNVRSSSNSPTQFYELSGPYMIVLESFDFTHNKIEFTLSAPGYFLHMEYSPEAELFRNRPLHQHNFFEIMFVLKGTTIQKIEDQQYIYHAGQCCLLNHNVKHLEEPTEDTELLFLILSDKLLQHLIHSDIRFNEHGHILSQYNAIYQLFLDSQEHQNQYEKQYWDFFPILPADIIVSEFEYFFTEMLSETQTLKPGFLLIVQGLVSRIFAIMLDSSHYYIRVIKVAGNNDEFLFSKIQQIMEEKNGRISREELEKRINYDSHYLNRIVKRTIGMSLLEYGRIFTLKEAARLLLQTDQSISSIMHQLGFSNRSYFYRIFKEQYGITPNEYRNEYGRENKTEYRNE